MILASEISSSLEFIVSMVEPSLMTVILSATYETSLSLWEMMIIVIPCSFWSFFMRSRSALESVSLSDDVGSSRIRSLAFFAKALAISTSCCLPVPISLISVFEESVRPTISRYLSASAYVLFQSIHHFLPCSLPRNMFSPIVM